MKDKYTNTSPSWDYSTENLEIEIDSDSDMFEGLLVDILNRLAIDLNFRYVMRTSSKLYGSLDVRSGNWSGIIGQLVNRVKCLNL